MPLPAAAASPAVAEIETPIEGAVPAAVVEAPIDAKPADSSTVDADDKKPSLLDVIQDAIKPEAEPAASSAAPDSEVAPDAVAATEAEPSAEDDAALPFHEHPRWKQVIAENQSLREPAAQYGKITGFMAEHGLAGEEVAEGFEVMALLKSGDPGKLTKARDWFQSRLQMLDESLGNVLPDDLQARVDSGSIDEEGAQELARARATETLRDGQAAARDAAAATAKAATDATANTTAIVTAVEGWETRTKATDPDYARKAELVQTTCRAIVQRTGKAPGTPEEAVALAEQGLAEVNRLFKTALPKPRAITPGPHGASTPTVAEPKTLREAINAAVA